MNSAPIPRPDSYLALETMLIGLLSHSAGFPELTLNSGSGQDPGGLGLEAKNPSTWLLWPDHRLLHITSLFQLPHTAQF